MSSYPRPDQPVIIQASRALRFITNNFLRRYGVVSIGDTKLDVGTCKEVYQDEINDLLSDTARDEFKKILQGYFMFATNKSIVVFEAGSVAPTQDELENKDLPSEPILGTIPTELQVGTYNHTFYSLFAKRVKIQNISEPTLLSVAQDEVDNGKPFEFTITAPQQDNTKVTFEVIGINDNGESQPLSVEFNLMTTQGDNGDDGMGPIPMIPLRPAPVVYGVSVKKTNEAFKLISEWVREEDKLRCYGLAFPEAFYYATADLANLCSEYVDVNSARFFMCSIGEKDPTNTIQWERIKNKKSFFGIYNNVSADANYNLVGVYLGVMASTRFDYSDNVRGKPLGYQQVNGVTTTELSNSMLANLTKAPINWGMEIMSNALLANGRLADGSLWSYFNQWDYARLSVQNGVIQLMIQATNVELPITYDNTGVKMLEANIKATLALMQSRGIISQYAQKFNPATNSLEGIGELAIIDAETYKKQNVEDYNNSIYAGISFCVTIQNFIQQVIIQATIN